MKEPFVVWSDQYSIGVDTVDEQHKGLFSLTNDLYDACMEVGGGVASEHFKDVLQKAVSYVAMHFSTEEKIMQATKDPNYDEHQREHDLFVRKVMKEAANLDSGGDDAPEIFMNFLRDWIAKHVNGTDIKIGQHIMSLKEKGALTADMVTLIHH